MYFPDDADAEEAAAIVAALSVYLSEQVDESEETSIWEGRTVAVRRARDSNRRQVCSAVEPPSAWKAAGRAHRMTEL